MSRRTFRFTCAEVALAIALAAWGTFPVVLELVHAAQTHTRFTGADGLVGAHGVLGADQLQYLAWVRDAAAHGLIANLFAFGDPAHVYLEPVFLVSGALYRAGLPLALAYLLLKPVAIIGLAVAAIAWARRLLPGGPRAIGARTAAVALTLFLSTPIAALVEWDPTGSHPFGFSLYLLGHELSVANKLWGYVPSALGLALVPISLLAVERALEGRRPRSERPTGTSLPAALSAGAALLASLLHPWQGITLVLIFCGLGVTRRLRGWPVLGTCGLAAAIPLAYYVALSHADSAWRLAAGYEHIAHLSALVLVLGFGPLAVLAALGLRWPGPDPVEQALLLWIGASFLDYFVNDAFAPHALEGLSFPFAVLAVRGGQRLRLPAVAGVIAVGLLTIPGLAYDARKFVRTAASNHVQYYLPHSDVRALNWIAGRAPRGGVLAATPFAAVVPSATGRAVWVGNGYWSPSYAARARRVDALLSGRLRPTPARSFVAGTGGRILISDCAHPRDLTRTLGPMVQSVRRFGCARVYVLKAEA